MANGGSRVKSAGISQPNRDRGETYNGCALIQPEMADCNHSVPPFSKGGLGGIWTLPPL